MASAKKNLATTRSASQVVEVPNPKLETIKHKIYLVNIFEICEILNVDFLDYARFLSRELRVGQKIGGNAALLLEGYVLEEDVRKAHLKYIEQMPK